MVLRAKNHEKLVKRTGAVIAAAGLLSSYQRQLLASQATAGGVVHDLSIIPRGPLFGTTSTQNGDVGSGSSALRMVAVSCAAIALAGLAYWTYSNFDGLNSSSAEVSRSQSNPQQTIISSLDHKGTHSKRTGTAIGNTIGPPASFRNPGVPSIGNTTPTLEKRKVVETVETAALDSTHTKYLKDWPGTASGRVVDQNGQPVDEVRVGFSAFTYAAVPLEGLNLPRGAVTVRPFQPVQHSGSQYTDSEGRFSLRFNTSGTAALYIDHEPYVRVVKQVSLPSEGIDIALTTSGGSTATGQVLDLYTGEPVAEAEVAVLMNEYVDLWAGDLEGTKSLPLMSGYEKLTTNENGTYTIDRMPSRPVHLMGWGELVGPSVPPELLGFDKVTTLTAGRTMQLPDLYLFPGYTLRGHVYDRESGQPVAGAKVGTMMSGSLVGRGPQEAVTDEKGYYEVTGLQPILSKARREREAALTFPFISVMIDNKPLGSHFARIDDDFDPDNLIIEHDFKVRQ